MAELTVPIVVDWDDIKEKLPHWIPFDKEPPKRDDFYLVTHDKYGEREVDVNYWHNNAQMWDFYNDNIIAWQKLPEPYKGEKS